MELPKLILTFIIFSWISFCEGRIILPEYLAKSFSNEEITQMLKNHLLENDPDFFKSQGTTKEKITSGTPIDSSNIQEIPENLSKFKKSLEISPKGPKEFEDLTTMKNLASETLEIYQSELNLGSLNLSKNEMLEENSGVNQMIDDFADNEHETKILNFNPHNSGMKSKVKDDVKKVHENIMINKERTKKYSEKFAMTDHEYEAFQTAIFIICVFLISAIGWPIFDKFVNCEKCFGKSEITEMSEKLEKAKIPVMIEMIDMSKMTEKTEKIRMDALTEKIKDTKVEKAENAENALKEIENNPNVAVQKTENIQYVIIRIETLV